MLLDKNSLVINGVKMAQYLTSVVYNYNKLWGEDSGRTLNGSMVATLVGTVIKIECSFRKLTKAELEVIAPILDSATQTVTYYDPVKKANTTIETYTGDWNITNMHINKNGSFKVSFIGRGVRR